MPIDLVPCRRGRPLRPRRPPPPLSEAGPAWSAANWLRAGLAALVLLAAMVYATRSFMVLFTATVEAASRALTEGSLTTTRADAVRELARERDRRREALAGYDRRIAGAAGDPLLRAAWVDLRRCEAETVERLGEHLDSVRQRPPASADDDPRIGGEPPR